jgi:Pyruvate/2-oxoacid:ferredoxin oxidoreductase delta subunit
MKVSKRVVLHFPAKLTEQPITYQLVKRFDIMFNILKARVSPEDSEGLLLMELTGSHPNVYNGLRYLKDIGVKTELLSQDIVHVQERCVHCGLCSIACPSAAFHIERPKMQVKFEAAKCIGCEECIKVCPYHAINIFFG